MFCHLDRLGYWQPAYTRIETEKDWPSGGAEELDWSQIDSTSPIACHQIQTCAEITKNVWYLWYWMGRKSTQRNWWCTKYFKTYFSIQRFSQVYFQIVPYRTEILATSILLTDDGDGCLRRNVLSPLSKYCHQGPGIVTSIYVTKNIVDNTSGLPK